MARMATRSDKEMPQMGYSRGEQNQQKSARANVFFCFSRGRIGVRDVAMFLAPAPVFAPYVSSAHAMEKEEQIIVHKPNGELMI